MKSPIMDSHILWQNRIKEFRSIYFQLSKWIFMNTRYKYLTSNNILKGVWGCIELIKITKFLEFKEFRFSELYYSISHIKQLYFVDVVGGGHCVCLMCLEDLCALLPRLFPKKQVWSAAFFIPIVCFCVNNLA